jgi:pantothenate synthetase
MKQKELKNIAKIIAKAERVIQDGGDSEAVSKAQNTILNMSKKGMTVEEMMIVDELVQEFLDAENF